MAETSTRQTTDSSADQALTTVGLAVDLPQKHTLSEHDDYLIRRLSSVDCACTGVKDSTVELLRG